jgi:hypothetical protein
MGTYRKVALTQGDRPLYQTTTASLIGSSVSVVYLFYWPLAREWRIGSSHTAGGTASVRSGGIDAALCPTEVTSWLVPQGTSWIGSSIYPITVNAPTLSPVRADSNAAPLRTASAAARKRLLPRRCAQCACAIECARRTACPGTTCFARTLTRAHAFGPRLRPTVAPYARVHTRALTNSCVHAHIDARARARCADADRVV